MRLLSDKDIRQSITIPEAIETAEVAFSQLSSGKAIVPKRTHLPINDKKLAIFMPAFLPSIGALGVKILSYFPDNFKRNFPLINGIVILFDIENGKILSLMDARYLTTLRTAAATALATKILANEDAKVLGIFGAGVQTRTQILTHLEVKKIHTVKIYDIKHEKAESLVKELKRQNCKSCRFLHVGKPKEVVEESDILITATTSTSPVFNGRDLKEGVHINAIGSFTSNSRELDDLTIKKAKIVVDSLEMALSEAGDIIIPMKSGLISDVNIYGEIGEIVLGKKKGRESQKEITLFKSVGLAIQDISIAKRIFQNAEKRNIGKVQLFG